MAAAVVQGVAKGTNGASISIGSGDGCAAPTSGNWIVVSANSDATVTISGAGWSAGPSIIDGYGAYVWYKQSNATETTITCTPSVSDDITITAQELSGVSGFDVQNSSTIASTNGGTTGPVSVTTTSDFDLVLAFGLIDSYSVLPSGASWSNSFTTPLFANSRVSVTSTGTSTAAGVITAGAAGAVSTGATFTPSNISAGDRQQIV